MESNNQYPQFIKNSPCGEDLFEGKSQHTIATNICNIIKTVKSCNVIGIDGGWGSGKSNLVKQVENILFKENYHFFIYDAWGHQEDLQRRSFLEELTEYLTQKELVKGVWKIKLKRLLSKVKETESKRAPKLSIGVIVAALAILITPLFKSLSEKITDHYLSFFVLSIPIIAGLIISFFAALPSVLNYYREHYAKLKVRCIDKTIRSIGRDFDGMQVKHVFDITITNTSTKKLFLSEINLEMKGKSGIIINSLNPFFIETQFPNKLEGGEYFQKIILYSYNFDVENMQKIDLSSFNKFRIIIENSLGKTYKSHWFNSPISYNDKNVKWETGKGTHLDYWLVNE